MNAANFLTIFRALAVLALIAYALVIAVILMGALGAVVPRMGAARARLRRAISPFALALAWVVSMIATVGSLYLSEIVHLNPCRLCWYQRIVMYPLVLLLGIAVFGDDRRTAKRYLIPLAAVGALISAYHYQLERFPGQTVLVCSADAPCSVPVVNIWGFASVPFMAMAAFLLIIAALALTRCDDHAAEEHPSRAASVGDPRFDGA